MKNCLRLKGWSQKIETLYDEALLFCSEKTKKLWGQPLIVNFTFEKYKYFSELKLVLWQLIIKGLPDSALVFSETSGFQVAVVVGRKPLPIFVLKRGFSESGFPVVVS